MEKQLEDAESRLKDQAAMIEMHVIEARTDALTGLSNRGVDRRESFCFQSLFTTADRNTVMLSKSNDVGNACQQPAYSFPLAALDDKGGLQKCHKWFRRLRRR